ncbi:MAG: hypothetical protein Alis3KO_41040 [Aliiglaciecola sp.]
MKTFLIIVLVVVGVFWLAIKFLRGFDKVAGRGPKQIKDGINQSKNFDQNRIPCPHCAELILPAAKKCKYCHSEL